MDSSSGAYSVNHTDRLAFQLLLNTCPDRQDNASLLAPTQRTILSFQNEDLEISQHENPDFYRIFLSLAEAEVYQRYK